MLLISLREYALLHKRSSDTVRRLAERGILSSAQKIGRNWVVNEDEAYPSKKTEKANGSLSCRVESRNLRVIDLFAGIGGIRLPFEELG